MGNSAEGDSVQSRTFDGARVIAAILTLVLLQDIDKLADSYERDADELVLALHQYPGHTTPEYARKITAHPRFALWGNRIAVWRNNKFEYYAVKLSEEEMKDLLKKALKDDMLKLEKPDMTGMPQIADAGRSALEIKLGRKHNRVNLPGVFQMVVKRKPNDDNVQALGRIYKMLSEYDHARCGSWDPDKKKFKPMGGGHGKIELDREWTGGCKMKGEPDPGSFRRITNAREWKKLWGADAPEVDFDKQMVVAGSHGDCRWAGGHTRGFKFGSAEIKDGKLVITLEVQNSFARYACAQTARGVWIGILTKSDAPIVLQGERTRFQKDIRPIAEID